MSMRCASPVRSVAPSWISSGLRTARSSSTGMSRRTSRRRCRTITGCFDLRLLFHILHHSPLADLGPIDVAGRVCCNALGGAGRVALLDRIRDERRYRAVLRAADADAALPAVMVL